MSQCDGDHFTVDDHRAVDGVSDVIDISVINPQSMLPAYLRLAIYLRGAIIVRQLPPGSPLASEPELSDRYKVSRDTVRRAMQLLRDIGIAGLAACGIRHGADAAGVPRPGQHPLEDGSDHE